MRDFYPEEMRLRNSVFDAWSRAAHEFGFLQYDSCVVENLGLFKRKSGEEIVEQVYAFTDKSGRELALRPEMTPTLARMIAARQNGLAFPLKWFATAQCFRYERMSKGRKREHFQWNLDIVGETSASAEAETVACATRALEIMGLNQGTFTIKFSSRALLSALLEKADIPARLHQPVFMTLDKRGKIGNDEINKLLQEAGLDEKHIDSVFNMMNISDVSEAADIIGHDSPCVAQIRDFTSFINSYGLQNIVEFDISIVRGLGYYTGIVFEAFDRAGKFRALFGGGRYDNLLSDLGGTPATAVGLGFGDVVVTELLLDLGIDQAGSKSFDMAIGYMAEEQHLAALRLASAFRKENLAVDLALSPEKARRFFSRAGKGGYKRAVYIGPDDLQQGKVKIKNLIDQTEEEKPI